MPSRREEFHAEEEEEEFDVDDEELEEDSAVGEDGIYEEEEDDDCSRRGGRKRRRSSVSQFIDDVAAVATDDEEEDDEIVDDGFIDREVDIPDNYEDERRIHRRPLLPREDEQEDVEEIQRRIEERYGRSFIVDEYDEEYDDEHEKATFVEQQALLPSVKGPKLWMVKCVIGREREVAVCLMQKCINLPKLRIKSVVVLDHLKNYIYIEAHKEAHVKEAIKGMRYIFTSHKILLVPIKEMADVLSVESKAIDISRDTWVRMKIGTYKGDLAKVIDLDNVKQRATVKLIPRIDLEALANKLGGREVPNHKRKAIKAPRARFMNVDEARLLLLRVERKRDRATGECFEKIHGMRFKDGFLYKDVSLKSLSTQNVEPTFDELNNFRQPGEKGNDERKKGHFVKGDRVIVVIGELRNLKGCVEKVEEDIVHITPDEKGLPKTLAISHKELSKCFEPGNHVKLVSGAKEGVTGIVVSVEGHLVNLVSDTTKELICAFADNVVESSEVNSESCLMDNLLTSRFGRLRTPSRVPLSPMITPRGGSSSHSNSGGRGGGRGRDDLIGASVKICAGYYKGCKGRVRDVKGPTVRVELESQMKVVAVDRSQISENVNVSETIPMHPPCTPLHPYMTPLRDSIATPYHDGMRTPMRGRAWNPYTPTTPQRVARVG